MPDIFQAAAAVAALAAPLVTGAAGVAPQDIVAPPAAAIAPAPEGRPLVTFRNGAVLQAEVPAEDGARAPELMRSALIAAEDAAFPRHQGIDPVGIARGALAALRSGRAAGGSTLTQQLVKNRITGSARTLERKIAEAVLAAQVEAIATKDEILDSYLRTVYFGRGAHGAGNAPSVWFGSDWRALTTGQIAFLAGLPKAPSALDPLDRPEAALARRDYVLRRLREEGYIGQEAYEAARGERLEVVARVEDDRIPAAPPDHVAWALSHWKRLMQDNPVRRGGAAASPIDSRAQIIAQNALADGLEGLRAVVPDAPLARLDAPLASVAEIDWDEIRRLAGPMPADARPVLVIGRPDVPGVAAVAPKAMGPNQQDGALDILDAPDGARAGDVFALAPDDGTPVGRPRAQGAVVVLDRQGRTLASIGGVAAWASSYDRTIARRQPGSTVKPFLWLTALEQGMAPRSAVLDAPITLETPNGGWTPSNYRDAEGRGPVPLYRGLEDSLNLVAAHLRARVGGPAFRAMLEAAGAYPEGSGRLELPAAALGAVETTPERMARAALALNPETSTIASARSLAQIERMMRGVTERGTARGAFSGRVAGVAGKTGTTQGPRDAWFLGRTGDLAIAVWIGVDDNRILPDVGGRASTGASLPAPIAARVIQELREAGLANAPLQSEPFRPGSPFEDLIAEGGRVATPAAGARPAQASAMPPESYRVETREGARSVANPPFDPASDDFSRGLY